MADQPRQPESFLKVFLGVIAAAAIGAGLNALTGPDYVPMTVVLCFILGVSALLLLNETVRSTFGNRFNARLTLVASNPWVWFGMCAALLLYVIGGTLVHYHWGVADLRSEIAAIRGDLKKYVLPGELTEEQISSIAKYLSQYPPHEIEIHVLKNDNEAGIYRTNVQKALEQGGWKVTAIKHDLTHAREGLTYHYRQTEQTQQRRPDPKSPKPNELIQQAFRQGASRSTEAAANQDGR